eukprot:3806403-Amphidinium_carterae.2
MYFHESVRQIELALQGCIIVMAATNNFIGSSFIIVCLAVCARQQFWPCQGRFRFQTRKVPASGCGTQGPGTVKIHQRASIAKPSFIHSFVRSDYPERALSVDSLYQRRLQEEKALKNDASGSSAGAGDGAAGSWKTWHTQSYPKLHQKHISDRVS